MNSYKRVLLIHSILVPQKKYFISSRTFRLTGVLNIKPIIGALKWPLRVLQRKWVSQDLPIKIRSKMIVELQKIINIRPSNSRVALILAGNGHRVPFFYFYQNQHKPPIS